MGRADPDFAVKEGAAQSDVEWGGGKVGSGTWNKAMGHMDPSPGRIKTGTEGLGHPLINNCLKKILMS